ncbi:MAG: hypothetical protein Q9225_002594, partial [Loekoesia sp. 1 TL-2023]
RILSALHGLPLGPTGPVYIFCDVRDAALAHVRALEAPDASGKRMFVVGGYFSNKEIEKLVGEKLRRGGGGRGGRGEGDRMAEDDDDNVPEEGRRYGFDNRRSRDVLGMEYRGLRETIEDTVDAIVALGAVEGLE